MGCSIKNSISACLGGVKKNEEAHLLVVGDDLVDDLRDGQLERFGGRRFAASPPLIGDQLLLFLHGLLDLRRSMPSLVNNSKREQLGESNW